MTALKNIYLNSKTFYVLVFGIFIAILMRNSALYPSIFADEYNYSSASRLLPLSQAPIANYLYLLIYRATNYCGDGFLSCARILNAIFFISACPFIYQTAKRVCSKSIARYIAILSLLGPINIYTANFMPEAMYFFVFWVLTWFALGLNGCSSTRAWFGVGALIGICMLIKPHGFFLLAPMVLYLATVLIGQKNFFWKRYLYLISVMTLGALLTKFLLGFLIAGGNGLSILGHLYSTTSSQFINTATDSVVLESASHSGLSGVEIAKNNGSVVFGWFAGISKLTSLWLLNLGGHLLGICLLFSLPVFAIFHILRGIEASNELEVIQRRYAWYTFFLVTSLIVFSSLFSGFISLSYGGEILRMHMRYYNFTFPLFLMALPIVFLSLTGRHRLFPSLNLSSSVLWVLLIAAILWILWVKMAPFQPTAIDNPELKSLVNNSWLFYSTCLITLVSLLIWPFSSAISVRLFFWIAIPMMLIGGSFSVNQNIWQRSQPDEYDRAGLVVKKVLTKQEISQLVVVGDNPIELSRVLFYLDDPKASLQVIKGKIPYEAKMLPPDKSLILLMDGHPMAHDIQNQMHFSGFTLGGGSGKINIDFRGETWSSKELNSWSGLFIPPEKWGSWSTDKVVNLVFKRPLPEQFRLMIDARAYGPNVDKPIALKVGDISQDIVLSGDFQRKTVLVQNPKRTNEINFIIPNPTSPFEQGLGDDKRRLGVGIRELKIIW